MKLCNKCNTEKQIHEFYNDRNKPDGKATTCKQCSQLNRTTVEYRTKRKLTRQKKELPPVKCRVCGSMFDLGHHHGQRDRKTCYTCEEQQIAMFGRRLSVILSASLSGARARALELKIPFDLTLDNLYDIIPKDGLCPILKKEMYVGTRYAMNLDRIVPEKGYTKGNVRYISKMANLMKSNATPEELLAFAQHYIN